MAKKDKLPLVTLRNAFILPGRWRNFGGEMRFNETGKRNFNVKLEEDVALQMQADGFNVKPLRALDDDDDNDGYRIEVKVNFNNRPPQVWMVSGNTRTLLDEGAINILDYADIEKASLMINPSEWESATGSGIAAYLHKAVIYLRQDDLDEEMADIPISGNNHDDRDGGVRFDDE